MLTGEQSAEILNDTVGDAAEGSETHLLGIEKKKLDGMGMIHDAVNGNLMRRNKLVSDHLCQNC